MEELLRLKKHYTVIVSRWPTTRAGLNALPSVLTFSEGEENPPIWIQMPCLCDRVCDTNTCLGPGSRLCAAEGDRRPSAPPSPHHQGVMMLCCVPGAEDMAEKVL